MVRPAAMETSARKPCQMLPGRVAAGEAPGCPGAMRTRSTAGRHRKRSGAVRTVASPYLGQIHDALAPVDERAERSDDVVSIDA